MESIDNNEVHFDDVLVRFLELFDRVGCSMYSKPNRYHLHIPRILLFYQTKNLIQSIEFFYLIILRKLSWYPTYSIATIEK